MKKRTNHHPSVAAFLLHFPPSPSIGGTSVSQSDVVLHPGKHNWWNRHRKNAAALLWTTPPSLGELCTRWHYNCHRTRFPAYGWAAVVINDGLMGPHGSCPSACNSLPVKWGKIGWGGVGWGFTFVWNATSSSKSEKISQIKVHDDDDFVVEHPCPLASETLYDCVLEILDTFFLTFLCFCVVRRG